MKFQQAKNANYYDLVSIPHGHIPAPMIKFWDWLPIPIKGQRDYSTFHCQICGSPSFFKQGHGCHDCGGSYIRMDDEKEWVKHQGKEKTRKKWKRFEHAILPLLVLFGKASYMPSVRLTYLEQVKKYGPPVYASPYSVEEIMDEPTGENCAICGVELTYSTDCQDHPQCCEEHGVFLPMCNSCHDFWMMNFDDPKQCIREWFKKHTQGKLPVSIVSQQLRNTPKGEKKNA